MEQHAPDTERSGNVRPPCLNENMTEAGSIIAQINDLLVELVRLDVSRESPDELLAEHQEVARMGRLRNAVQSRYDREINVLSAPELPGGGLARSTGHGNAGKLISQVTGGSVAGARRSIEAGEALAPVVRPNPNTDDASLGSAQPAPKYPALAEAALEGDLSVEAMGLIAAGLNSVADRVPSEKLHEMERRLVEKAKTLAAHEVKRMVGRAVARVDQAGHEERERRQHADRYLTWTEDHTGMVTFSGRLDAVTAAPIRTTIEQMVTAQFRARRDQDPRDPDQRTVGQMRADALFEICRHALGCKETHRMGIRTQIVLRASLKDFNAGSGLGSIDGTEQLVSVSQLRRLAGDAGIVPEVLADDGHVLDLGRTTRFFTAAQRQALLERDGGCAKCHAPPEHCEAHHIRWWQHGGRTDLSNGVMLCTRCHHDVHRQGWGIVVHGNYVEFIPPPDIDPQQRPRPGGIAAIDIGDIGLPVDAGGFAYPGDEFFADDEELVRQWMSVA